MPAVSKDQQTAARIALDAKREGKIKDLPKRSISAQMIKSMSDEDLEDFAEGVKEQWEDAFLVSEEMIDLNYEDADDQIVTQKSKVDIITDKNKEDSKNKSAWTNTVAGTALGAGSPLSSNSMGAARTSYFESKEFALLDAIKKEVANCGFDSIEEEEIEECCESEMAPVGLGLEEAASHNSLDLLFEQDDENYMSDEYYDLMRTPKDEHNFDVRREIDADGVVNELILEAEKTLLSLALTFLTDFSRTNQPTLSNAIDAVEDAYVDMSSDSPKHWYHLFYEYGSDFGEPLKKSFTKDLAQRVLSVFNKNHEVEPNDGLEEGAGTSGLSSSKGPSSEEKHALIKRYRGMADAAEGVNSKLEADEYNRMADEIESNLSEEIISAHRWKSIAGIITG